MNRYYAIGDHVFLAADVEQAGTSAHAHPVVVIDPETASDADLAPLLSIGTVENARDVLRAMLNPKPEVYSHITVMRDGQIREALCGKVWEPTAGVNVVGKCPNCRDLAEEWTA